MSGNARNSERSFGAARRHPETTGPDDTAQTSTEKQDFVMETSCTFTDSTADLCRRANSICISAQPFRMNRSGIDADRATRGSGLGLETAGAGQKGRIRDDQPRRASGVRSRRAPPPHEARSRLWFGQARDGRGRNAQVERRLEPRSAGPGSAESFGGTRRRLTSLRFVSVPPRPAPLVRHAPGFFTVLAHPTRNRSSAPADCGISACPVSTSHRFGPVTPSARSDSTPAGPNPEENR